MGQVEVAGIALALLLAVPLLALWRGLRGRQAFGTAAERAAYTALHEASLAGPPLRQGLTAASAEKAVRHLHALLGTPAVALTDTAAVLAWDGIGSHHAAQSGALAARAAAAGRAAHG